MTEWKTIESAPQDGTECWLSIWANNEVGKERCVVRGFFDVGSGQWRDADVDLDGNHEPLHPPTHWQLSIIPDPPVN